MCKNLKYGTNFFLIYISLLFLAFVKHHFQTNYRGFIEENFNNFFLTNNGSVLMVFYTKCKKKKKKKKEREKTQ